jgi:itaconate CoA-transferase
MAGPLDGILVVAMDQAVAAPLATSRLADAGARVIKVERPGGDFARGYDEVVQGQSSHFVWLNRGKESIEFDIKNADDKAILDAMIARADIFVQNLAPGAAARAGFGSEELRARHPKLITCDISGYGEDGPYAQMKAYDLLIQCESGLTSITGTPDNPGRVGISIVDIAAGMNALAGILEALHERTRTGRGKGIKISLFDCMADWMTVPQMFVEHTGNAPERVGINHPSIAPYGAYETRDKRQIVIAIQNEREWVGFCKTVLGDESLGGDEWFRTNTSRVAHRDELNRIIGEVFYSLDREAIVDRLAEANIAYGNLNDVTDLLDHPQLRRVAIDTPGGAVNVVANPIRFSEGPLRFKPVPNLGEHSNALRKEFAVDLAPQTKKRRNG